MGEARSNLHDKIAFVKKMTQGFCSIKPISSQIPIFVVLEFSTDTNCLQIKTPFGIYTVRSRL